MADAGLLSVKITADDAQLVAALARARTAVKNTGSELISGIAQFAKYGAAAGAAGVAIGAAFVHQTMEAIDTQAKLARQLGGTTAAVQTLERAGALAGVSTETLTAATGMLNVKLGQAMEGAGTAVGALNALNLSAEQLSKLDADERMATIADAIDGAGLTAQQTASILRDLGIRQAELISLFEGGGGAIRAARADIEGYGVAVSEIDAAQIEAANDAMTSINMTMQGIATQAAIAIAPVLQEIGDRFAGAAKEGNGFREIVIPALEAVATGVAYVGDAVRGLEMVWLLLKSGVEYLVADMMQITSRLPLAITDAIDASIKQVNRLITAANDAANTNFPTIKLTADTEQVKAIRGTIEAAYDQARATEKQLEQMASQDLPSDKVEAFFENVRKRATESAEAVVSARRAIGSGVVIDTEDPSKKKDESDKAEKEINSIRIGALDEEARALAELQAKYARLNEIIAEQPQLQQQAAEAAAMLAEQYQAGIDAEIAAGIAKHEAFLGQLDDRVQALAFSNQTEIEMAISRYETDQELLEEALLNRVITEQQYNDMSAQQSQMHEDNMRNMKLRSWKDLEKLTGQSWKTQALIVSGTLAEMTAGLATKSRTMFEINKAASAANAAMRIPDMMSGAYNAMVGIPYVGPALGAAAAIAAGAFGAAQVQAILSTSYGSGAKSPSGGIPSAATSVPTNGAGGGAPAQGPSQTLAVQGLDSGALFDGKTVRALAEKLVEFQKDGGKVVFTA